MAQQDEGVVVQNGEMAVRITCDLSEAQDLWCIHHDIDWPRVLRLGIAQTIQTHLPRGTSVRLQVDVTDAHPSR